MPKKNKEQPMISFGGVNLLVDLIGGFCVLPVSQNGEHGVAFILRSGETVKAYSNSKILCDYILKYLQKRFGTVCFASEKCSACAAHIPHKNSACARSNYNYIKDNNMRCCDWSTNYQSFRPKPEEECKTIISSLTRAKDTATE